MKWLQLQLHLSNYLQKNINLNLRPLLYDLSNPDSFGWKEQVEGTVSWLL